MYWGEHFSKGHVTWTSRPAPRLTLSDVQRRGPRTVMRVRLGVAMNYGCTRPGRTLLAVAAFSSSTAAAGGTGRIRLFLTGKAPKPGVWSSCPWPPCLGRKGARGAGRRATGRDDSGARWRGRVPAGAGPVASARPAGGQGRARLLPKPRFGVAALSTPPTSCVPPTLW